MKTWEDYKKYVKQTDDEAVADIEEAEELAKIIGAVIQQRKSLGISQRDLAVLCEMPQSSIARIESFKTTPRLDTILRIMKYLGIELEVNIKGVSAKKL